MKCLCACVFGVVFAVSSFLGLAVFLSKLGA